MSLTPIQRVALGVVLLCIAVAVAIGLYLRTHGPQVDTASSLYTPPPLPQTPPTTVVVHVAGAVSNPGVYSLPKGSRAQQAVEAAGGFLPTADRDAANLAALLQDGQKIDIPRSASPAPPVSAGESSSSPARVVDVNAASAKEIEELPGIGPKLAQQIVDYRTKNGPFKSLADLDNVPGIGAKRLEQLKPYVNLR